MPICDHAVAVIICYPGEHGVSTPRPNALLLSRGGGAFATRRKSPCSGSRHCVFAAGPSILCSFIGHDSGIVLVSPVSSNQRHRIAINTNTLLKISFEGAALQDV